MLSRKIGCLVLSTFLIAICLSGCAKEEEKKPYIPEPTITYNISGYVLDYNTVPVSDATVKYIFNSQTDQTTTDANGNYRFTNLNTGIYTIDVTKSGYTFGRTKAEVTKNGAIVSDVVLSSLKEIEDRVEEVVTADDIKTSGAEIVADVDVTLSAGGGVTETKTQVVSAEIPAGTEITINDQVVTGDVSLAVTPMKVDEIPPPPEEELPLGAVLFEPVDAKFSNPVAVKLPVEIQLQPGLEIPLKKYEDGEWKDIGTATIDDTGLGADAEVTEFGQFAVQPDVSVEEEAGDPVETQGAITEIPSNQTSVKAQVTDTVEFTDLPAGVTEEYALSLIEKMKGITIGETKNVLLELPTVSKTAAKQALPLSPEKIEPWIQTCKLIIVNIVTTESITINIDLGGNIYTFTIYFTYTKQTVKTECSQSWVEHDQGGSE